LTVAVAVYARGASTMYAPAARSPTHVKTTTIHHCRRKTPRYPANSSESASCETAMLAAPPRGCPVSRLKCDAAGSPPGDMSAKWI
jgi:hypothetical protein